MIAHRQQYRQQRRPENPPALLAFQAEESQQEQEDADGSQIHRSRREGLRPVVGVNSVVISQMRWRELVLLQRFRGFSVRRQRGRSAAVVVRNHQVRQFLPAVAPGGGVRQVQTLALFAAGGFAAGCISGSVVRRLCRGSAPHRILGIIPSGDEFGGVCADAD